MNNKVLYQCKACGYRQLDEPGPPFMCPEVAEGGLCGGKMVQVWPARWTPLEEDKPEPGVHVCMLIGGFWFAGFMDEDDRWWVSATGGREAFGVTAWMDGPELPEEVRHE